MRNKSIINLNLRWFLAGMIFANIGGQMAYSMLSLLFKIRDSQPVEIPSG